MSMDVQQLSNEEAVAALSLVAQSWMDNRGREVYMAYYAARTQTEESYAKSPSWARDVPAATDEAG